MPIIRGADFLPMHLEYVAPSSLEMIVVLRIALAIFGDPILPPGELGEPVSTHGQSCRSLVGLM